jgi:hypothetical protein
VILFDDVVQVGTISNLDGIVPTVVEFVIHAHAAQSGMGEFEAIQGNYSRLAVALILLAVQPQWYILVVGLIVVLASVADRTLTRFATKQRVGRKQ